MTDEVTAGDLPHGGHSRHGEVQNLRAKLAEAEAENAHLRGLLRLSPEQARRPGPVQTAIFDATPGAVSGSADLPSKVAFYASLFRGRQDVPTRTCAAW